jgi:hypothetical protein
MSTITQDDIDSSNAEGRKFGGQRRNSPGSNFPGLGTARKVRLSQRAFQQYRFLGEGYKPRAPCNALEEGTGGEVLSARLGKAMPISSMSDYDQWVNPNLTGNGGSSVGEWCAHAWFRPLGVGRGAS